ncbi:MAG: response regulator [Nibricoccus sp.]
MARVLVVDDDEQFRAVLVRVLLKCAHEVKEARNGREALVLFSEFIPDIVVTDIMMPEKDGLELVPALRRQKSPVKIIACSGGGHVAAEELLHLARLLGADRVLFKPFALGDLTSAIETLAA